MCMHVYIIRIMYICTAHIYTALYYSPRNDVIALGLCIGKTRNVCVFEIERLAGEERL